MKAIKDTELILTNERKVYHLNLSKEEIADTIIIVGDQLAMISMFFHLHSARKIVAII